MNTAGVEAFKELRRRWDSYRATEPVSYPGPATGQSYLLSRRVFFALLGLSYLSAFISFGSQARGLLGPGGILPVDLTLEWAREALPHPYLRVPSLLWLSSSDGMLLFCCGAGALCAVAVTIGLWSRAALALAYVLYLSLVSAGGIFFGYQWDILLLETGFLAIFLAPLAKWLHRGEAAPPFHIGIFLAKALLFRLTFMSGVVKLTSGDPNWRSLNALQFHYWTQPLPTWTSYFVDLFPKWIDQVCEAAMLGVELGTPFLLFFPRRGRQGAVVAMILLQLAIAATGNYGFFNLLTVALCALQLDDSFWRRVVGVRAMRVADPLKLHRPFAVRLGWAALATVLLLLGVVAIGSRLTSRSLWPQWVDEIDDAVSPYHLVSGYGLFAVMTTERGEIDLQGSADGKTWRSYAFKYKPGPLDARPRFALLHMPRVDWQMWFASLGDCSRNEWLLLLQQRLLEGRPAVSELFAEDPFAEGPPKFLRTRIAPYRFAPLSQWRKDGRWWTRGAERDYCPTVALDQGRLKAVSP